MTIQASDFGIIALLASIIASFLLLYLVKIFLTTIFAGKAANKISLLAQICIFSFFIVVPLALCTVFGAALHWLHHLLRGPFTYGTSGYESSYDFAVQLIFLGLAEFGLGLYWLLSAFKRFNNSGET